MDVLLALASLPQKDFHISRRKEGAVVVRGQSPELLNFNETFSHLQSVSLLKWNTSKTKSLWDDGDYYYRFELTFQSLDDFAKRADCDVV